MNSIDEHLEKARHNLAFLDSINLTDDDFADWAIVALFYAALHFVRAVLHDQQRDHGTTHSRTQSAVQEVFPEVAAQSYERLYSRSRLVRYEVLKASLLDFQRLRDTDFDAVFRQAQALLQQAT